MISIYAGLTSQTVDVFLQDSSSTTGAGLTGLTYNSSGLACYYRKGATGAATAITLASQTVGGAWTSGGFIEISAANMPGVYRLDLPDAAVDSAGFVTLFLTGATNLAPLPIRVDCRAIPAAVKSMAANTVTASALAADAVTEIQSGLSTLDAAGVRTAVGLASDNLDTQLADLPTVAEFEARTLPAAAYFDPAADTVANVTTVGSVTGSVGSISGVSFPANFGSLLINVSGHISRVVLVDTTTANSDMRGTDSAALASEWTATRAGYLDGVLLADNFNQRTVQVTGSNHIAADVHEFQPDVLTSAATAASFVAEVQSGLATSAALAVVDGIVDQLKTRSGYTLSILAGAIANAQNAAEAYTITLDGTAYGVTYSGLDSSGNRTGATLTET